MVEYEIAVSGENVSAEEALNTYSANISSSYETHRAETEVMREETINSIKAIGDEYFEIGKAFKKEEQPDADEEIAEDHTNDFIEEIEEVTASTAENTENK